jgi:hypothetical protein
MVFKRKYIVSFALTLPSVDSIAKFVSAFTRSFHTLFTKHNIRHRTDSLLQSKGFMVADEICCAGKLVEPTSETYHKGDVKCREFSVVSHVNYWVKFCTTKQDILSRRKACGLTLILCSEHLAPLLGKR